MENFIGLLYNSGTTQEGLAYKNGFGSVYTVSGASAYDKSMINISGFSGEKINETQGFILWLKFKVNGFSTNNKGFLFTTDNNNLNTGPSTSAFTIQLEANVSQNPYLSLNLGGTSIGWSTIQFSNDAFERLNIFGQTASTFNLLIYKDKNKNFTDISAFTTYMNNYKKVHLGSSYGLPDIYLEDIKALYKGAVSTSLGLLMDMNLFNIGLARTTMTPAEFNLFAQKMHKYDNYWHLFENETDTPNIKQSDIMFYMPFYQKFGGNSTSSRIDFMYPKSTTKFAYSQSDNTSVLNTTLGPNNRWRRPYPPHDPYI
jgi:hypothetical protein